MSLFKKNFLLVLIICSCFLCFSFKFNKNISIKGYINTYGNEPFSYLGISTTDDKSYYIKADTDVMNELKMLGGKLIKFEGRILNEEEIDVLYALNDGGFEVFSYKVIKPKSK